MHRYKPRALSRTSQPATTNHSPVRIKLTGYGQGSDWLWLVDVVNDKLHSFLVLHSFTCGYICVYQQVDQSIIMNVHIQTLINISLAALIF